MPEAFDFAVSGINHNHIYGQVDAMLAPAAASPPSTPPEDDLAAEFAKAYPQARRVADEREILDDPAIRLVVGAGIPGDRAAMALRAMRAGKDVMVDKPGCTTEAQLAELPRARPRPAASTRSAIIYFKTMGLPLVAGRGFTEQDVIGKPWRTSSASAPLTHCGRARTRSAGRRSCGRGRTSRERRSHRGRRRHARARARSRSDHRGVFPAYGGAMATTTLQLVMQTKGKPEDAVPAVRTAVSSIDPGLPISSIRTLEELITTSVATRRFTMTLLVTFAGLALVLALAGVYGVLAYSITRRTQEIGVRLALGAEHGRVLRSTILRGLRPVLIGVAIGLGLAFWLSRFMTTLLFNVTATDATTYVGGHARARRDRCPLLLHPRASGPARRSRRRAPERSKEQLLEILIHWIRLSIYGLSIYGADHHLQGTSQGQRGPADPRARRGTSPPRL